MIIKELYYYERETGKFTVSTEKPDCDYSLRYRLIAENGKELTKDGERFFSCVDVYESDGWYEVVSNKIEHSIVSTLAPDEISPEEFMALVEEAL